MSNTSLVERCTFFQHALRLKDRENKGAPDIDEVKRMIHRYALSMSSFFLNTDRPQFRSPVWWRIQRGKKEPSSWPTRQRKGGSSQGKDWYAWGRVQGWLRYGFYLITIVDLTNIVPVMPDLLENSNVNALHLWEGSWSYLTHLKWCKVNSEGQVRPTSFPSGGTNWAPYETNLLCSDSYSAS